MFKTLLKKQMMELFFKNSEKSKRISLGKVAKIILLVLVFAIFCGIFFAFGYLLGVPLFEFGSTFYWFYFLMASLMAVGFGVFGSIFSTYSSLYLAKDNELLLSMPIPPKTILFVRLLGVYLLGLIYEALVFAPMLLVFYIFGAPNFINVLFSLLLFLLLSLYVFILSCGLGYIVALISARLKNKGLLTAIISLAVICVVYFFYFGLMENIDIFIDFIINNVENIQNIEPALKFFLSIIEGNVLPLIILVVVAGLFIALIYFLMSKSFIKLTTINVGEKSKKVKEISKGVSSPSIALLKKEFKKLFSSSAYILNCALGTLIMPILGIFLLLSPSAIEGFEAGEIQQLNELMVLVASFLICYICTVNNLTAPSVSLEGKNIWISKTLPVKTSSILFAKVNMHIILTTPSTMFFAICLAITLKLDFISSILVVLIPTIYSIFNGFLGLIGGLLFPKTNFVNEVTVIKQGMATFIGLFGSWAILIVLCVVGFFLISYIPTGLYIVIVCLLLIGLIALSILWILKIGVKKFENLQ